MNASLPSSKANVYCFLGQTYYAQRDYTNAILWERKALKLDAHYAAALFLIGEAQMATGDYSGAVTNFEMQEIYSGANASAARSLSEQLEKAIAEQAARGYWKTQWADMENYQDAGYYWKAVIQLNLGHTDQAFEWLTNSYKMHERDGAGLDGPLSYLFFDPWWNGLHDDPRFRKLLDDIGYTKVIPPLKK
jgi:tetratricopeptide (TPR) repeat protein